MAGRHWSPDVVDDEADNSPVIAFVGQAPGRDEDQKGMPFVGPAGQVLQQAVNEFKLQPAFFTNVVRCFPGRDAKGNDYAPTAGQIEACAPYLENELKKLKPSYIVAVGGHALKALTGRSGVTQWAGTVAGEWKGIPVFAMLHPSFILRKPQELPRFEAHAKALADLLRPKAAKAHPPVQEKTPAGIRKLFERCKSVVAFDYETATFSPWDEGAHIRCVSFSLGNMGYWMRMDAAGAEETLQWFLESDVPKAAQNAVFEGVWSLATFGIFPNNLEHDTLLLAHLADENGPKGLDMLAARYLGAPNWDIAPKMREKEWTFATAPIEELGPYNALDAAYTAQLVEPILAKLSDGQRSCYQQIMLPLAQLCARMQFRGMHVDKPWAEMAIEKYKVEMVALDAKIRATPEVKKLQRSLPKGRELNYRSPVQMRKLLFEILELPEGPTTKSGEASTSGQYLERIKNPPALLTNYLDWKERETVIGKYLEKFPKFCDEYDIIHPSHSASRIVTGRTAVTDPPVHGTPKGVIGPNGKSDGFVRGMFNSRFDGGLIMSSDYKALEFRLVCSESGEKKFIDAFVGGLDPHALTATDLFGKNFTPYDRDRAKITNFSLIYGVTEYSLAPKLGMTEAEALKIIIKFKKAHPDIFIWMERQYERARKQKMAVNRFGRVRHLPDVTGMEEWRQNEVFREAGNFPIQSAGADITNLSAIEVDHKLRMMGMKSKLVLVYHDALIVDVHPKEVAPVEALLVKVMQEEIPGRLPWLRLPLTVDLKKWDRWEGAKWPTESK